MSGWYPEALVFLGNLLLAFAALNLLAWAVIRCMPGFFVSLESRMRYDPGVWYAAYFKDQPVHDWYGLTKEELQEYLAEITAHNYEYDYDRFSEYRHKAHQGRYLNVSEHGFRLGAGQGPWPPDPACLNIFFFGGSTAFNVGADWTSISSRLQERLDGRPGNPLGRPVRCYNFGRFAYYSSQELALFQRLLEEGSVPHLAVFFHGLNDCVRAEGETAVAGIYREALRAHYSMQQEFAQNRLHARIKWIRLWLFFSSLPLMRLAEDIGRHLAGKGDAPDLAAQRRKDEFNKPLSEAERQAVAARLLLNHRRALAAAELAGCRCLFVLQPNPAYKYDLSCHKAHVAELGLRGNERAAGAYPLLREELARTEYAAESLLDLSDMQEGLRENLYLDEAHYTAEFSGHIAQKIADHILSRPELLRGGTHRG